MNEVKIIKMTDDTATVGGYGVVFGGVDLEGETFTPETDYDLDLVPTKLVLYDHARQSEVKHQIGSVTNDNIKVDDVGLWIEAQLDISREYVSKVLELVKAGVLGWSSGSVGHLAQREKGIIKTWPIVEFSLTPTPAEPRTLGVERIKALAEVDPSLEALIPEAAKDTATDSATAEEVIEPDNNQQEIKTMEKDEFLKLLDERDAQKAAEAQKAADIEAEIEKRAEAKAAELFKAEKPDNETDPAGVNVNLKTKRGDDETKALCHYIRTGDEGALSNYATKASNAVDMTIADATYAGNTVPTGHYQQVIARRDEMLIAAKLGIRPIPGKGTTVNVPFDNEADGEFILTSEAADHDLDAPLVGQKALTLLRYTKKYQLSYELLEDEDSNLMAWLNDFVGRGTAKTHNNLLLTEVASNGTALNTFASATVIAVDELEPIVYNNDLSNHLDDAGSVGWVMQAAVHGEIAMLDDANIRRYANNQMGNETGPNLLGYPIVYSAKSGATAASAKSVYFGNWNYVGWRDAGIMTFIRDPYSFDGGVELKYQFRTVYGVLIAEAIGYGVHPSA
jgi:HK97 family phage major capsid protein